MKRLLFLATLTMLTACHKKSFEERVMEDVEKFNREEAPKRVDPITVQDSVKFAPDTHTLTYFYTMEGDADNEEVLTEEVRQTHHNNLLKNLRGSIQLKPHKEQGFSFEYRYYSKKSGKLLIREQFVPEDYR